MAETIKIIKPLPPQETPSDTVSLPRARYFLKDVPGKTNPDKNIIYPPPLPTKSTSNVVTNKFTAAAANTVYIRSQQPIEYLHEKYETKPTEPPPHKNFYVNHTTTASPDSVPHTYKHLSTNYLVAQHILQNHANHIYDE